MAIQPDHKLNTLKLIGLHCDRPGHFNFKDRLEPPEPIAVDSKVYLVRNEAPFFDSELLGEMQSAITKDVDRVVKALHQSIEEALIAFLDKAGFPSDGSVHYTVYKTDSHRGGWIYSVQLGDEVVAFAELAEDYLMGLRCVNKIV